MTQNILITDKTIDYARQLIAALESGDETTSRSLIDQLADIRESELFQEIGKLTRELHNAIVNFEVDPKLATIASTEIPDAKERLNYVISMTNQAANRTLTAVEAALPVCEDLHRESQELNQEWVRFNSRQMTADEFRSVNKLLQTYLPRSEEQLGFMKAQLTDVLMAQEFQDLTGQIINRVIKMVEDVEAHLVNLIKVSGAQGVSSKNETPGAEQLHGPAVPGLDTAGTVSGQDEVDDLLSSLGF